MKFSQFAKYLSAAFEKVRAQNARDTFKLKELEEYYQPDGYFAVPVSLKKDENGITVQVQALKLHTWFETKDIHASLISSLVDISFLSLYDLPGKTHFIDRKTGEAIHGDAKALLDSQANNDIQAIFLPEGVVWTSRLPRKSPPSSNAF